MLLNSEDLTLSIVSHGHGSLLERLLHDIAAHPGLARCRVIVTLNLPDEQFDQTGERGRSVEVVRNSRPRGFGANHNAAFLRCRTRWFAVLNPDLRLPADPFPALLAAAQRWPDVALLAPRVVNSSGTPEDSVRANLTPASLAARRLQRYRGPLDSSGPARPGARFYWLAGMFMLVRSDAFRQIGGFDERYFLYCEDYDLCARLYTCGHGLTLVPQAQVVHDAQRDSHRSARHLRWHLISLLKVWTSQAFWRVTLARTSP